MSAEDAPAAGDAPAANKAPAASGEAPAASGAASGEVPAGPILAGLILAGGAARRMGGRDKALLPLGGETLLARAAARLAPQVGALGLSANGDPARFAAYGLPVIPDPSPELLGPLAGILAGLDWAAALGGADPGAVDPGAVDPDGASPERRLVSVAADTPFFPQNLVARLSAAAAETGAPIVLAATRDGEGRLRPHPTFGLWPLALREDLRAALARGMRKVMLFADRHGAALAEFPAPRGDPFFNINAPDDLAEAERMLQSGTL